jgi:poly(hydroxyalkanoate) granule-associated protein
MVKKLRKMAEEKASASGLMDSQLAQTVKDSAQQIWLAGLGAFAKAQEEGGKVFDALVKEGATLQRKTQTAAGERLGDVSGKMSAMAEGVSSKAGAQWDKLESLFEDRVSKALNKLGVPSAKDVDALVQRIDALSAQVSGLPKAPAARTRGAKPSVKAAAAPANGATKPSSKRAARKTGSST